MELFVCFGGLQDDLQFNRAALSLVLTLPASTSRDFCFPKRLIQSLVCVHRTFIQLFCYFSTAVYLTLS